MHANFAIRQLQAAGLLWSSGSDCGGRRAVRRERVSRWTGAVTVLASTRSVHPESAVRPYSDARPCAIAGDLTNGLRTQGIWRWLPSCAVPLGGARPVDAPSKR